MTTKPNSNLVGEAFEEQRADIQLAAIKGTSEIVSAFLQKNAAASLADTKDLLNHVGLTFQAYITATPVPPKGAKLAGLNDDARAKQALSAATRDVVGSEPRGSQPAGPAAKGQYADVISKFKTYVEAGLTPAVPIKDSVNPAAITCLHTGESFKMMKGHLKHIGYVDTKKQNVLDRYREFWMLPQNYPLVASNYSKERRKIADRTSTGRKPGAKTILKRAAELKTKKERQEYLVKATVFPNYIISLIDSTQQKHLDLHVETNGMKWEDFLTKFELPSNYPKEAASVAAGQDKMRERRNIDTPKMTGTG